jgi:hypothetical protein
MKLARFIVVGLLSACTFIASDITDGQGHASFTLDPPGGTYDHGILVVVTEDSEGDWYGGLELSFGGGAYGPYGGISCACADIETTGICIRVSETMSFSVRESGGTEDSPETHGEYVINLPTENVVLNGTEYDELRTYCWKKHSQPDESSDTYHFFRVVIALQNTTTLGDKGLAYLLFRVEEDPQAGDTVIVGEQAAHYTGIEFSSTDDDFIPSIAGDYQADDANPCTVTFTDFARGGKAAGTIECDSLSLNTLGGSSTLGSSVSVARSRWVCDQWGVDQG